MGADNLAALVNFLSEGLINDTLYINYATKATIGANLSNGQTLYNSTCALCHGANGRQILFDGTDGIGDVAKDNPWETLHKIRAGQPATGMPSAIGNGWSLQDAVDVLGYAQTLPTK
ncbi:MAG: cytochrome c family protein [Dehalococcoidia bacterium]|nr:cytochrome c family protein [Dehalococcoidia bacterium]